MLLHRIRHFFYFALSVVGFPAAEQARKEIVGRHLDMKMGTAVIFVKEKNRGVEYNSYFSVKLDNCVYIFQRNSVKRRIIGKVPYNKIGVIVKCYVMIVE